jgi:hypothetical protein
VEAGVVVTHPNRNTAASNLARSLVIALLGISIALMLAVLALGWTVLEGMLALSFAYMIVYVILAWRVSQWARGPLAVGAALAILLAIFTAIAFPTWADRNAAGYAAAETPWGSSGASPGLLGLLTLLIVVAQIALVIASIHAFRQEWQVELETAVEEPGSHPADSEPFGSDRPGLGESPDSPPDAWN